MIDPPEASYTIRPVIDEDRQMRELPPAVRSLIEARTGDAVYVVDPDYRIVHWDSRMKSLTGALAQEALGQPCY
jgi:PAS domain-containing protein